MSSSQVLAYWKKDKFAPLRASLLIQGQISYFFIGQGGLVRFSCAHANGRYSQKNKPRREVSVYLKVIHRWKAMISYIWAVIGH